jgi:site-specific DNA-methyltransferase (adenine-specific)
MIESYNPDVLTCLANLSNDEVFTPPELVNDILDLLPQELFTNKETTFLDPVTKSGIFLREIAKRLMTGLESEIPDKQTRVNHIFKNQLFGIAITELTSLLSRRSVYCTKTANSRYSVCNEFDNEYGNIIYNRINHKWVNGKCLFCGASKKTYSRSNDLETHAYQFIHTKKPKELFNMKFDVIIGNPPYQLSDGGSGTGISAKPIYHYFVQQAKKLNPRYMVMITPSRWFAGGKGLHEFREEMLNDKRLKIIYDFMSSKDCFPGVNIAGGVNYFLWDNHYYGDCEIVNCSKESDSIHSNRPLDEFPIFIRDNRAIDVIHKFIKSEIQSLSNNTFTRNPFGFVSKERGHSKPFKDCANVKLISSGGIGYLKRSDVKKNIDQIDKYKVTIGKIVPSNGEVDTDPKDGYKVTTSTRILLPGEIHTESYLLLHGFDSHIQAENFAKFMALKFPRFMMKHTLSSMNISTQNFMFVPFLDFSREWTDRDLYEKFMLNSDEIDYIESMIRPMD